MTSISTLHGIGAALAIGGFAAGTALFGAGAAYADPMGDLEPLLSSSCSFAQIDSALHQVAPDTAAQLDAAPGQKAALKNAYDQPADQRRASFQQLIAEQQRMGVTATANQDFGAKMSQVVDTCHQY
ncbi:hemophore-related protein [Nocardia sp. NBC_01503]|uniref:hemophore-related protein n=1 Tax=Nocardia sp. NBC_01503 TaxID=2975997 RepID=UPI002E7B54E7|nr:hemophore-related protein [Nocardia sp. NBC_01503]WTL30615.1 hemophore-related protein [Nocardia sp. NBC_01503]